MLEQIQLVRAFCRLAAATAVWLAALQTQAADFLSLRSTNRQARVVIVENPNATF